MATAVTSSMSTSTTSSSCSVILWEWLQNTGIWQTYDSDVVAYLEDNYGKGARLANLGLVNQSLSMYNIDLSSMCQVRLDTGGRRSIQRQVYKVRDPDQAKISWEWAGDYYGLWNSYNFDVSCLIESVFAAKQTHFIDLSQTSFKLPYFVDLKNLQQVRIETGTARSIRRILLNVPYPTVNNTTTSMPATPSTSSSSSSNPLKNLRPGSSSPDSDSTASSATKISKKKVKRSPQATTSNVHSNVNGLHSSLQATTSNVQANVNGLPSSLQATTSNVQSNFNGLPSSSASVLNIPQMTPYSNNFLYGSQIPGVSSSIPFINSLALPVSSSSSYAPIKQASSGPLTRQQFQLMQSSNLNNLLTASSSYSPMTLGYGSPSVFGSTNSMMNIKGHGSKISPVVSNITNVLTSPIVPGAFTPNLGPGTLPPSTNSWTNTTFTKSSSSSSSTPTSAFPTKGHITLPKLKKSKGKVKSELPSKFLKAVLKPVDGEDCCICCEQLTSESTYGTSNHTEGEVVSLSLCDHMFHRQCLLAMYDSGPKDGSIQCPNCKKIHGLKQGICPAGEMDYWTIPDCLAGYEDCSTICVRYFIKAGVQGPEHPSPGRKFTVHGFPRVGFLPNNEKGRKILQLFTIAWTRRIMFTIGTSSTSGYQNTVTWNEIHHKTEFGSNCSGHGYPDPHYLDNVLLELGIQGVTEEDLNDP